VDPTATAATAIASLAGATTADAAVGPPAAPVVSPAAGASLVAGAPTVAGTPAIDTLTPEMSRKRAQIEWAVRQDEIKKDPHGQWAVRANASSAYNDAQGTAAHSASQATGVPDVEVYGNNIAAWTPKTPDGGIEWLELQFAKPVHATTVRVRESYGPGAVIKVELVDEQGAAHTVWTGSDASKDLDYLTVEFPRTAFKTSRVKVTLATNTVPGFNEIDAVQLVGTER
jgi:hypothetical protein